MPSRTMFPRDIFAEFDRLQDEMQQIFDSGYNIRGAGRGSFPALNVGGTPQTLELYAFAPGLDPASIDIKLEHGVVTISGERAPKLPAQDAQVSVHVNERFSGRFRRVISLPEEEVDPDAVSADYHDGVLHISAKRHAAAQPRRINIA